MNHLNKERLLYFLIRGLTYPFGFFPYSWIRAIGKIVGWVGFYCMESYRKRALSNLALATDLGLSPKEVVRIAKQSFQNLAINCLEYPKFAREKHLERVIQCQNPEAADALYKKGQGIIFFCGHQSNWEVLFLDGTRRMRGVAIGKAIKNKSLYNWILKIRERCGGKIISPHNAVREGLRALRKGSFVGIVGDQGMPSSGYSFPFLGRRAWTSTAPALLAYKTNSPLIFAATHRTQSGYQIRYADPIWPDLSKPLEEEVVRMMDQLLSLLQASIAKRPGEWLWQHNRWKQQTPQNLYKQFRKDCLCVILPSEESAFLHIAEHLPTLKQIYPSDFLFLFVPARWKGTPLVESDEILYYERIEETLLPDYRFKLVFNFTDYKPIKAHYKKLSTFEVLTQEDLYQLARNYLGKEHTFSDVLKRALCRPGSLWSPRCPNDFT